jgi:hypothetical protein
VPCWVKVGPHATVSADRTAGTDYYLEVGEHLVWTAVTGTSDGVAVEAGVAGGTAQKYTVL